MGRRMKDITSSVYTFENLISGGFLYVDKTEQLWELMRQSQGVFFLSRPRRFGKSLAISTLKAAFQGKRQLFEGLALYDKPYDWKEHPVIHLDLGICGASTAAKLEIHLSETLQARAADFGLKLTRSDLSGKFTELVESLAKRGKVVILIDEYDKPLIDNLLEPEVEAIRKVMDSFYAVIKGTESCQRFVLMTGVSKFSKVSVFSKLNNLVDLTMDERCATMFGYTQQELEANFADRLDATAVKLGMTKQDLLAQLKEWYNGYRFHHNSPTVYNPVSIAKFFESGGEFNNFWFATGTPSFLLKLAKEQRFDFEATLANPVGELAFDCYEVGTLKALPLLFQTGYLTIVGMERKLGLRLYRLGFPNREVEAAFECYLLDDFANVAKETVEPDIVELAQAALDGDVDGFMERLKVFFANVPYDIQLKDEKYYQTIFFVVFRLLGFYVTAEARTNKGRIDATVETDRRVYVLEFKLDGTAAEALAQIRAKDYPQKYLASGKEITLIGAAFDFAERNLGQWLAEPA